MSERMVITIFLLFSGCFVSKCLIEGIQLGERMDCFRETRHPACFQ